MLLRLQRQAVLPIARTAQALWPSIAVVLERPRDHRPTTAMAVSLAIVPTSSYQELGYSPPLVLFLAVSCVAYETLSHRNVTVHGPATVEMASRRFNVDRTTSCPYVARNFPCTCHRRAIHSRMFTQDRARMIRPSSARPAISLFDNSHRSTILSGDDHPRVCHLCALAPWRESCAKNHTKTPSPFAPCPLQVQRTSRKT
jgi:hypothetical protein